MRPLLSFRQVPRDPSAPPSLPPTHPRWKEGELNLQQPSPPPQQTPSGKDGRGERERERIKERNWLPRIRAVLLTRSGRGVHSHDASDPDRVGDCAKGGVWGEMGSLNGARQRHLVSFLPWAGDNGACSPLARRPGLLGLGVSPTAGLVFRLGLRTGKRARAAGDFCTPPRAL